MKRNVLLLCHGYEAPFLSVANQYAALFKNTDFRVITVFIKGRPDTDVLEQSGADEVIFLDASPKQMSGLKRQLIKNVRELHLKYQFEFAIAHRYKSIYIASHIKQLFVIGVAHIDGVFNPLMRKLFTFSHRKNLLLLGVSKAIRDDIRRNTFFFDNEKVQHLYNSLDFESIRGKQLSRSEARQTLSLPEADYLFVNVGRLHEDKDQTTLIKAFAKIHHKLGNAKLIIAGKGRLQESLEKLCLSLNISNKVIFLGQVRNFYQYFRAFDSFVLSSIREGLPVALLEALAANVISIASNCNGSKEAIEGIGYSFNIGDEDELARQMMNVYSLSKQEQESIRTRMQEKIASHFSESAVKEHFWQLVAEKNILAKK